MKSKKMICVLLTALMLLSVLPVSAFAADPVQITTAQQLQNINNDVAGSYILMNDIDLAGVDFTPIGNADSGAFSGTFDGNGKTIRNLDVFSGKYAGLFGCNEGTIKNVTLENIYVYGTRYVGGAVGENTALGTVENCSVKSGRVESDGGLSEIYVGGVVGINRGALLGALSNGASVCISTCENTTYAGGIAAYSEASLSFSGWTNRGGIKADFSSWYSNWSGGLLGFVKGSVEAIDSVNYGAVSGKSAAGIAAECDVFTASGCANYGNVGEDNPWMVHHGGIVGSCRRLNLNRCRNIGDVRGYSSSYSVCGLAGEVRNDCVLTSCYNAGCIVNYTDYKSAGLVNCHSNCKISVSGCWNSGYVRGNGLVRADNPSPSTITNCFTTGNVANNALADSEKLSVANCYAAGSCDYIGGRIVNCYFPVKSHREWPCSPEQYLSEAQMKNAQSFAGWDFDGVWTIDPRVNSGYPTLRGVEAPLMLNVANETLMSGSTLQLRAYKNGVETGDVTWYTSYGDCVVDGSGRVVAAGSGSSTVTAVDAEGNKANCNLWVMTQNTGVSAGNSAVPMTQSEKSIQVSFGGNEPQDYIVSAASSDPGVLSISGWSSNCVYYKTNAPGTAVVSFETAQGFGGSCSVRVMQPMRFAQESVTCYVGDTGALNLIRDPDDTSGAIGYSSSNTSVVSVNSSTGVFTAKATGTATITARNIDSGAEAKYVVTVKPVPVIVTSLILDETEKDLNVGETFRLTATVSPDNATDKTVTWATTDESVASVSQLGRVEAVGAGKALITCESSNGIIAYCVVNVTGVASTNLSKIYIPDLTATEEETVTVPVMIERNPGVSVAALTVSFDGSVLEAQSIANGEVFASCMGDILSGENKVKLYFVSDANVTANGALAYITFKVLDPQKDAAIRVGYFPSEIRDENDLNVSMALSDGVVFAAAPQCAHGETEIRGAVAATCTEKGYTGDVYCKACGELLESGSEIPASGHDYGAWTKLDATHHQRVCANDASHIEKAAHTWNSGKVTKAATCTAAGVKTYTCTVCKATKTETIAKLGHAYGAWAKLDATHHQRVCANDASHIEKAAHTWNAGKVTKAATCTAAGVKTYTCTVCKATKTESIAKLGHNYSTEWTVDKAATCTAAGSKSHHCARCDAKGSVTAIPATGHSYGAWAKLDATYHKRVCANDASHVEKAAHAWNSGKVTKAATATATGVKTYTCTVCKATKTETIPKALLKLTPTLANGKTGVSVKWTKDANADGYIVYRKTGSGGYTALKKITSNATVSYADTTAVSGTAYTYAVRSYRGTEKAAYTEKSITFLSAITPTLANAAGGVNVKWTKVTGAAGYYVYRKTGTGSYAKIATIKSGATVSFLDKNAASGTAYTYAVKAYSGSFAGAYTGKSITFLSAITPTLANAAGGVNVKWTKVAGATGYYVYRKTGSGSYERIATIKSGATVSCADTAVKDNNGTAYTYAVRAYKGKYLGVYTAKSIVRLTGVAVSSLTNPAAGKMTVKYGKNAKATGYQIQYAANSKFTSAKTMAVADAATLSKTIASLTKGTTYYVRVRAYKTVSGVNYYSAWSAAKSVKIVK